VRRRVYTGAIAKGRLFRREASSLSLRIGFAPISSGGTHEQICDPAFDTRHIRGGADGGSDGHISQGRDEQHASKEA
jgi:hypothetical protein